MRIVSLLPSATEMVCLLGLQDQLVGVTHECDFPAGVSSIAKVTRTLIPADASSAAIDVMVRERVVGRRPLYELDVAMLAALGPDLVVTQALCDVCAVDEREVRAAACAMPGRPRVLNLEPVSLEGVFEAIGEVARAAGVVEAGVAVVDGLRRRVREVTARAAGIVHRPSVVFLEWLDPLFCAGHWNPELVRLAGGEERIGVAGERSRRISFEEVAEADPDVIFIACCGLTIERALVDLRALRGREEWEGLRAVREGRVFVADGSAYFNRPGPRLVESLEMVHNCIVGLGTASPHCFRHVPIQ